MALDVVETLRGLVAVPSVNPMGRPVSGPEYFEYRMTEHLEQLFQRCGLAYERQPVDHLRDNIFVRVDGDVPPEKGGRLLLLEAHQDTVPVDGMTIPPWTPTVKDGRVYGRGSCDIKGGMAAMLAAVVRLAEEKPRGRPTVVLACTVNEEHGFTGATALEKMWNDPGRTIIPRRPDACVVAEPTLLNVVTAHKGCLRWKLRTHGRACHSSQPHLGENAVYKMARVLQALEAYQQQVAPRIPAHRLCGSATLSVGTISGGLSVNTVPDVCTIEIDRRILPGENIEQALQEIIGHVARFPGVDFTVEHEAPFMRGAALSDGPNQGLADQLTTVARSVAGQSDQIGVPYGTDASKIAMFDVPSVVLGPGSIDQAHTADEWLAIDQLQTAAEVYYHFARQFA